jgi:hypothetical protein
VATIIPECVATFVPEWVATFDQNPHFWGGLQNLSYLFQRVVESHPKIQEHLQKAFDRKDNIDLKGQEFQKAWLFFAHSVVNAFMLLKLPQS